MTPKQRQTFNRLVNCVPDYLKADAASKIKWALENRWKKIEYWDNENPHPADLVGIGPTGEFDFLPDPCECLDD